MFVCVWVEPGEDGSSVHTFVFLCQFSEAEVPSLPDLKCLTQ